MSDTTVTVTLDRERPADLRPRLEELERTLGAPVGVIVKRVLTAEFAAADCATIVRLALIGGGATPKEAADLAADYCTARPLAEQHALATTIILAVWGGAPKAPAAVEPEAPVFVSPNGAELPLPPVEPAPVAHAPAWSEAAPTVTHDPFAFPRSPH